MISTRLGVAGIGLALLVACAGGDDRGVATSEGSGGESTSTTTGGGSSGGESTSTTTGGGTCTQKVTASICASGGLAEGTCSTPAADTLPDDECVALCDGVSGALSQEMSASYGAVVGCVHESNDPATGAYVLECEYQVGCE